MKKTIRKFIILVVITFSLNACSTPEERAVVVDGSDSTSTGTSASTDSLNAASNKMGNNLGVDSLKQGDSTARNNKMESFRHTPIDTITSLRDSTKQ